MALKTSSEKTVFEELPLEFRNGEYESTKTMTFKDVKVLRKVDGTVVPWVGKHKHVYRWWILANGYAIGCNENPSRGMSFPVIRMNK